MQDGRAVSDYFALLKETSNEILLYHPLSCDAQTRKAQWEDFLTRFLLSNALARVLRVIGSSDSISSGKPPSPPWQYVVGRPVGGVPHCYCTHCGRTNHVVDKCWIKHGKPDWANTVTSGGDPAALEPTPHPSESVTLSREEYEQLLHRPVANSATPPTSSSPDVFAALHGKSWMLDSGATTHLTEFPVNLLSISQLTQKHNCSVTFFPSYCVFQDLQTRRTIGGGHERGGLYFLNTSPPIEARALSASVSLFNGIVALAIRPFLHYRKSYLLSRLV
ncbi:UNVERIFIED_CONTAM: hypothetical protein Sangu_0408100 [Sesamum angustifolium]|uniref:Uncharacterized protein n=1 Tax=Sesamum angustifolium TaxID=2727405 RepID=A0AAW2QTC4_9LAMI